MFTTLVIIGNGFDIFHGIKSKYNDFKEYVHNHDPDFVKSMEKFISANNLWSNFEIALGKPNKDALQLGYFSTLNQIVNENEYEYFIHGNDYISEYLLTWIKSINLDDIDIKFKKNYLSSRSLYINFNYTSTLEKVYNIPREQIYYIHRKADENSKLIFGHCDIDSLNSLRFIDSVLKDNYDEYDISQDNEWNLRYIYSNDIINNYYFSTYKDVYKNITINEQFYQKLKNIKKVYVLGHSLSEVDLPYFKKINKTIKKSSKWVISYYGIKEKKVHQQKLQSLGIFKDRTTLINLQQLCKKVYQNA